MTTGGHGGLVSHRDQVMRVARLTVIPKFLILTEHTLGVDTVVKLPYGSRHDKPCRPVRGRLLGGRVSGGGGGGGGGGSGSTRDDTPDRWNTAFPCWGEDGRRRRQWTTVVDDVCGRWWPGGMFGATPRMIDHDFSG